MGDANRAMVMSRRNSAIADFSEIDISKFGLTVDEARKVGLFKVNAQHSVGIATSTEVGLPLSRYPIRIILNGANEDRMNEATDTCVSYWVISNAANQALAFQRKPLNSEVAIANLYRHIPEFDNMMWAAHDAVFQGPGNPATNFDEALNDTQVGLYGNLCVAQPTDEQKQAIVGSVRAIFESCIAAKRIPYFKIDNDYYIRGVPHGHAYTGTRTVNRNTNMLNEVSLTILVNRAALKVRYPNAGTGAISIGAYSIASMFRFGLFESYEHKEFVTVVVTPVTGSTSKFTVSEIHAPEGYEVPEFITVGKELDTANVRLHQQVVTVSILMIFLSGLMHYLFNHTTGGTKVSGPLLTACAMYKWVTKDMGEPEIEEVTSILYDSIHSVNKRAIANIFFKTSKVYTHGKMRGSNRYDRFELDAFAAIRGNPFPAGSHKAYVCTQALKKVIQSGMGPFLPWAGEMNTVVNMCKDVLSQGARSHIGASYYTGQPPVSQASGLDVYLPELARFMQIFHRYDSLASSPHLGEEVAARANVAWSNMLKEMKAKDLSNVSSDIVREFLATTGVGSFGFDPEDKATWGKAATVSQTAIDVINSIFT